MNGGTPLRCEAVVSARTAFDGGDEVCGLRPVMRLSRLYPLVAVLRMPADAGKDLNPWRVHDLDKSPARHVEPPCPEEACPSVAAFSVWLCNQYFSV
jgi:hypothetical protein